MTSADTAGSESACCNAERFGRTDRGHRKPYRLGASWVQESSMGRTDPGSSNVRHTPCEWKDQASKPTPTAQPTGQTKADRTQSKVRAGSKGQCVQVSERASKPYPQPSMRADRSPADALGSIKTTWNVTSPHATQPVNQTAQPANQPGTRAGGRNSSQGAC